MITADRRPPENAVETTCAGPDATARLAEALAPHLACPDILTLEGELGTGKTVFARALIRARLGPGRPQEEVPSPTFTLVQTYAAADCDIWHFDLYRLDGPADAIELDIDDAFATAISIVEWPDRLGAALPTDRLQIAFSYDPAAGPDSRQIRLVGHGSWRDRLASIASDLR